MFDTRLVRLLDRSYAHIHEHHQLVMSLIGRAESEVNGCGGEVCQMRTCLMPDGVGHVFIGVGDDRMLIIDLGEDDPTPEDPDLLVRLFEAPCCPALDADSQNLLSHVGAELVRYDSDPLPTRTLGGVLIRALHLRLFDEQQPPTASGPLDLEHLDAHIVRNLARHITVAELAQVACLSPSHFYVQFEDSVGLTPHQHLLGIRLDRTARLLWESRLPLVRIAEECGFSSWNAPTAAMCRYLGLTPRSLRKGRALPVTFNG